MTENILYKKFPIEAVRNLMIGVQDNTYAEVTIREGIEYFYQWLEEYTTHLTGDCDIAPKLVQAFPATETFVSMDTHNQLVNDYNSLLLEHEHLKNEHDLLENSYDYAMIAYHELVVDDLDGVSGEAPVHIMEQKTLSSSLSEDTEPSLAKHIHCFSDGTLAGIADAIKDWDNIK